MAGSETPFLLTNLDFEKRLLQKGIVLLGDIDHGHAEKVARQLFELLLLGYEKARLIIQSPGGFNKAGYELYDTVVTLVKSGLCIEGFALGQCSSMAIAVMQACSARIASINTRFMLHDTKIHTEMRIDDRFFDEEIAQFRIGALAEKKRYFDILRLRMKNIEDEALRKLVHLGNDGEFLYAAQALEYGLIDHMVDGLNLFDLADRQDTH